MTKYLEQLALRSLFNAPLGSWWRRNWTRSVGALWPSWGRSVCQLLLLWTHKRERDFTQSRSLQSSYTASALSYPRTKRQFSDFSFLVWAYSLTVNRVSFRVVVETRRLRAVISSSGKHWWPFFIICVEEISSAGWVSTCGHVDRE